MKPEHIIQGAQRQYYCVTAQVRAGIYGNDIIEEHIIIPDQDSTYLANEGLFSEYLRHYGEYRRTNPKPDLRQRPVLVTYDFHSGQMLEQKIEVGKGEFVKILIEYDKEHPELEAGRTMWFIRESEDGRVIFEEKILEAEVIPASRDFATGTASFVMRNKATGKTFIATFKNGRLIKKQETIHKPDEGFIGIITEFDEITGAPKETARMAGARAASGVLYEYTNIEYMSITNTSPYFKIKAYSRTEKAKDGSITAISRFTFDEKGRIISEENLINGEFTLIEYNAYYEEVLRITFSSRMRYNPKKHNAYIRIARTFGRNQTLNNTIRASGQGMVAISIPIGNRYLGYGYEKGADRNRANLRYGIFAKPEDLESSGFVNHAKVWAVRNFRLDEGWQNIEFFDVQNDGVRRGKASNETNGEISFSVFNVKGMNLGENTYRFEFTESGEFKIGELIRYSDSARAVWLAVEYESGAGLYDCTPRAFDSESDFKKALQRAQKQGKMLLLVSRATAADIHEIQDGNERKDLKWVHIEYARGVQEIERAKDRSAHVTDRRLIMDVKHLGLRDSNDTLVKQLAFVCEGNDLGKLKATAIPVQYSTRYIAANEARSHAVVAVNSVADPKNIQIRLFYGENLRQAQERFREFVKTNPGFVRLADTTVGEVTYTEDRSSWIGLFETQRGGRRKVKLVNYAEPVRVKVRPGVHEFVYGVVSLDLRDAQDKTIGEASFYIREDGSIHDRPFVYSANLRNIKQPEIRGRGRDISFRLEEMDPEKIDPYLPIAADVYRQDAAGNWIKAGVNIDYRGRNFGFHDFKHGIFSYDAWNSADNTYLGQYAFKVDGGQDIFATELNRTNIQSWSRTPGTGHYANQPYVYIIDTNDESLGIPDDKLQEFGLGRGIYILTESDLRGLNVSRYVPGIKVVRIAEINTRDGRKPHLALFDSIIPGPNKEYANMWDDNIAVRVNYSEVLENGEVITHIRVRDDAEDQSGNVVYGLGNIIQLGIKINPEQIGRGFDSAVLPQDEYFIGVYSVPEGHEIQLQYPDINTPDSTLAFSEPRKSAKKPQPVILDSIGRIWVERSGLGITIYDRYQETLRRFSTDKKQPDNEALDIIHSAEGIKQGMEERNRLWTIEFRVARELKTIGEIGDLFNALPPEAKARLVISLGLNNENELNGLMLVTATKKTQQGAVFREYYIADDVLGRRFATEINGAVIFADRWNDDGEVTHSYKMTRDSNIIFEYDTLRLTTWADLIRDYLSSHDLRSQEQVSAVLKSVETIFDFNGGTELALIQETPWIVRTENDRRIYARAQPSEERSTLLVMLPNDSRGRDIIRILPKKTVFQRIERRLSDAIDWRTIIINKWHEDGIPRSILLDSGATLQITNPYGVLPGRYVVNREYNDFRIEDRDYIGTIHVSCIIDAQGSKHFEPLYMLDDRGDLVNPSGERIDQAERDRLISQAQQDPSLTIEEAYVHRVKAGELLVREVLSREGTLAMSVYNRQLIRLANGMLSDLRYLQDADRVARYLSGDDERRFPSGIITLGLETVYYDLNYPYQKPLFARDTENSEIKRWIDISYDITENGEQIELHRVLEKHPQAPNLEPRIYIYKYINGELVSKKLESDITDRSTLWQIAGILLFLAAILVIYPFVVNKTVRKEKSPYKEPKPVGGPSPDDARKAIDALRAEIKHILMPQADKPGVAGDAAKASSAGTPFGFSQEGVTKALIDISDEVEQQIRQGRTQEQIISDEFANFINWCDDVNLSPPVSLKGNVRAYVLYKGFVHTYPNNFSNTTPNMIFFLLYRSLQLLADGKEQDIAKMLEGEAKFWATLLGGEYGQEKKGYTKRDRMTYDDIDDHFGKEEFVKNYDTNKTQIKDALSKDIQYRKAKDRQVYKTYQDEVGPYKWPAWTRKVLGVLHIAATIGVTVAGIIIASKLMIWIGAIALVFALGRLPIILLNNKPVEILPTYRGWKAFVRTHIWFVVSIFAGASIILVLAGWLGVPIILSSTLSAAFIAKAQALLAVPAIISAGIAGILVVLRYVPRWGIFNLISLKEEPTVFQSDKAGTKQKVKPALTELQKQERTRAIKFWLAVFVPKIIWNVVVFTFLAIPSVNIWLAGVGVVLGFPLGSALIIAVLWSVFALLFFVDVFSFFYLAESVYSYWYGRRLGLGRVTSEEKMFDVLEGNIEPDDAKDYITADSTLKKAKGYFISHMTQEGGLDAKKAWNLVWKHILLNLVEEAVITKDDMKDMLDGKRVNITEPEGRERLFYFVNSMLMNMPDALDWDLMDSLTANITGSGSKKSKLKDLNGDDTKELGVTKLTLLISRYEDSWQKQCTFMQDELATDGNGNITNQEMFDYIESLRTLKGKDKVAIPDHLKQVKTHDSVNACSALEIGKKDKNRTLEYLIEDWANMRFWAIYKNIRGLMRIREAFEVYALICFKNGSEKTNARMKDMGEENYERFIEKLVDKKYQPLTSPREAEDFVEYLDDYAKLQCVFMGPIDKVTDGAPHFSSRYIERPYGAAKEWQNNNPDYVVRARVYKAGVLKTSKPESQNKFIPHITGKRSLFFDSNSATSFEDAIKIPMALSEFHHDPSLKFVNFAEHIFTRRHNWKAMAYGTGDRTWVTSVQRVLARFGAIGFYGHAAIIDTTVLKQAGVIPPDYVSEDLMLAIKAWLKDAKGAHREYLQFGKARQVDFIQAAVPFMKFISGAFEMAIGRQIYRILRSNRFPWWSKMMLVFTLGFYFKKPAVAFLIPIYLTTILFLGVSGFVAFPLVVTLGFFGIIISQVITLSTLYQLYLEGGGKKGMLQFIKIYPSLLMQFVTFVPYYHAGSKQGLKGASEFISTGKDWFLEFGARDKSGNAAGDFGSILTGITSSTNKKTEEVTYKIDNTTYKILAASILLVLMSALGIKLWWSAAILWSIFYIISVFFWGATPFLSRTGSTPAEFGWKTWARLVFVKDPISFARIYKEIFKLDKQKNILSEVSLTKIF
ncbi:MAG: hypothetical protein D4S01_11410, partial [Dehalococcoidia bacterium]